MRKFWMIAVVGAAGMALIAGCGQGEKQDTAAGDRAAVEQAAGDAGDGAVAGGRAVPVPEGTEAVSATFEGTIGCGHCTYHTTPECALAMKTGDGTVYVIENDPEHEAHMGERFSGKPITVVGTAGEKDGMNVIYAEKVELK